MHAEATVPDNKPAPVDYSDPAFAERLTTAMNRVNIPAVGRARWISEVCGFHLSAGGFAKTGRIRPSFEKTKLLARRLGVSHEWLRFGDGPMLSGVAPLELVEPRVLVYVPAKAIPPNSVVVSEKALVPYEDYEYLVTRLIEAEDRLAEAQQPDILASGDPRGSAEEVARTPLDWAAKTSFLIGEAAQKTAAGDHPRDISEALTAAMRSMRAWAFAIKGPLHKRAEK